MTTTAFICFWLGMYDVPREIETQAAHCANESPNESERTEEESGD